jgi:hypothetical protein
MPRRMTMWRPRAQKLAPDSVGLREEMRGVDGASLASLGCTAFCAHRCILSLACAALSLLAFVSRAPHCHEKCY